MYDPQIGQFLTADPIGFKGGDPNLFRYVGNAPTNAVDPTGLSGSTTGGGGAAPVGNVPDHAATLTTGDKNYYLVVAVNEGIQFGGGTGHSWAAAVDATTNPPTVTTRGFGYNEQVAFRDSTPGVVRDEADRQFTIAKAFPIDKAQYDAVLKKFDEKTANPGIYRLRDKNCTTWVVVDIMKAAGLRIKVPQTPRNIGATDVESLDFYSPDSLATGLQNDATPKSVPWGAKAPP